MLDVLQHYVDLNDPFLAENAEYLSQQDYLSMLNSPTYTNLDRETGEPFGRGAPNYVSMRQRAQPNKDAQEETELRPMLSGYFVFMLLLSFIYEGGSIRS